MASLGDANAKKNHQYANYRRNNNTETVWEVVNENGNIIKGGGDLEHEALNCYKNVFKDPSISSIMDQMKVIAEYHGLVSKEEAFNIVEPIYLEELNKFLEAFQREKIPGPDFFDIMGEDLLAMVEESRFTRKVNGAFNETFLTLIPKKDKLDHFFDFRPISLWNLVYKMITKNIENRIKPFLSKVMSKE